MKRKIKFEGILQDNNSFKQYFLLFDALLCLEWRIKAYVSDNFKNNFDFLSSYFERVLIVEDFTTIAQSNRRWLKRHRGNLFLHSSSNNFDNLIHASKYLDGVDEVILTESDLDDDIYFGLLQCIINCKHGVRRVDLSVEHIEETPPEADKLQAFCECYDIDFHIITKHDNPDDEWYSRPGVEEMVDADPIPYKEGNLWCSITADTLYYKDGFHLNEQRVPYKEPFYDGTNPYTLMSKLLQTKLSLYNNYRHDIQMREGNIYWNYFNWVADNIIFDTNFTVIPNFVMRPDTQFYKQLICDGYFIETKVGLLKKGSNNAISIIQVKHV